MSFQAQNAEKRDSIQLIKKENHKFNYKQLIVPTVLMGYGLIGLESDQLKLFNAIIKEEVNENIDKKFTIDDISQYAPAVSVYALNLMGIKGKHNFRDRSIILGTAYILMGTSVYGIKKITKVQRPDKSNYNSFPSGHTATAFMGAEFMWQEYKDVSVWYGISGYIVAAGTGVFRIYNDKHWLTDIAMGAGLGMLSTKAAYWLFPFVNNHIFKSNKNISSAMVAPFYNGNEMGVGMLLRLN
tara:strand:- start:823 stop:1545 length:723 start_codon:yes stop_codon:yes gene_type:complete